MFDRLAALHYPHDRGLRLVVPVSCYPFVSYFVLLLGLLQLNLVYLDTELRVFKCGVVREFVRVLDFFALGLLT